MTADPALGFWLRYAESEGALHEQVGATTAVLLPETLRTEFGLPEELSVTADPEVAREDDALLLAPGHALLNGAAERVLDRGDVGRVTLAWPSASMPSADALVERLREQVTVGHGRIDTAGEPPAAGYLPVLRVGALVTYTVTLDDRFQERQETWVDATTGLPLTARNTRALSLAARSEALAHRVIAADRAAAASAAQAALEQAAGARLTVLASQSRTTRETEVARIQDYYRAALESLARRRATAPPDRHAMLDSRAAATKAERDRRLAEVDEKFRGSVNTRWFRLHEVLVPALTVPVLIRRGRREYPFSFRWLLPLQGIAAIRCPHCGAVSSLVAGKERLGCERCLPRQSFSPERPAAEVAVAPATPGPAAVPAPAATPESLAAPAPVPGAGPAPARRPTRPAPAATRTGRLAAPAPDLKRLTDDGNRLAVKFWEDVAREDRRVARLVVPGSPAEVSLRLWGPRGPGIAVGVPPIERPSSLDAHTAPDADAVMQVTGGWLRTDQQNFPFTLRWQGGPGRPGVTRVGEVIGGRADSAGRLSPYQRLWWRSPARVRMLPRPRIDLDPVASALWDVELTRRGFPSLLRCLTAWWRAGETVAVAPVADVAAAVARLVAARAGTQVTIDAMAREYDANPAGVRAAGTELRRSLQLSPGHGW